MNRVVIVIAAAVVASGSFAFPLAQSSQKAAAPKSGAPKAVPAKPAPPAAELDKLLAPIALYPDQLLAQILLCAQNPSKLGALAEWMAGHESVKGSALQAAAVKSGFEPHFAVRDWKLQLVFELQTCASQFVKETHVIGLLEKTRAQRPVHGAGGPYDSFCDVVDDHHTVCSSASSASSAVGPSAVQALSPI